MGESNQESLPDFWLDQVENLGTIYRDEGREKKEVGRSLSGQQTLMNIESKGVDEISQMEGGN